VRAAALLLALSACAHRGVPTEGFFLRFGLQPAPTLLLVSPSWSDRGLAMLEWMEAAKRKQPELQLALVLMDELPVKQWQVVAKALKVSGAVRRSAGLGLEAPPFGPIKEVPQLFWVDRWGRIVQRAHGFIPQDQFDAQTAHLLGR